ncbi:Ubiquinone biosynthesis protein coq7 [Globisporangium polare]
MLKPAAAMDPVAAREMITAHAATSGFKAGSVAALIAGSAVFTANTYSQAFRTRLGVSGKWGLVVSSFLGTFAIVSDKAIVAGARNPERYIASMDPNFREPEEKHHQQLKLYQRAANFLYDHPYRTLATVGVPLVGGIYAYQATNHAIARSQQIMHTRIYGQGAVVLLLLGSMAFHDYMLRRGRFQVVSENGASDDEEL